jgi:VanZ family protein
MPESGWSSMLHNDGSDSRRHGSAAPFSWRPALSWSSRNRWLAALWVAAVIAAVVLAVLPGSWVSLTQRGLPDALGDVIEPLSHFLGYAVLVGFASLACNRFTKLMYVLLAAIVISGALELVQLLVPERGASFEDFAMNVLGASVGCLFGAARPKRKRRLSGRGECR